MIETLLSIRGLSKFFGETRAVDAASFELAPGATLVIRGSSGGGKTTLLRLLAGLELPDAGEMYIHGALASRPGWVLSPYRRGMGFVFQTPALWPHLTVAGNILFGLTDLPRAERQLRLKKVLESVGLPGFEQRYPDQLSGGQARRVALARTLAPRPPCLLMDEPLVNLDEALKTEMLELIIALVARNGTALVYVTHDAAEAEQIGGRVLTMEQGRLGPVGQRSLPYRKTEAARIQLGQSMKP